MNTPDKKPTAKDILFALRSADHKRSVTEGLLVLDEMAVNACIMSQHGFHTNTFIATRHASPLDPKEEMAAIALMLSGRFSDDDLRRLRDFILGFVQDGFSGSGTVTNYVIAPIDNLGPVADDEDKGGAS